MIEFIEKEELRGELRGCEAKEFSEQSSEVGGEFGGGAFPDMVEAIAKNVSRIIMYAEEIAERLFEE